MAVRYGPFKAHFVTRSGFGTDAPENHNPPLLFNVEVDPSEREPLNTEQYPEIMKAILKAYSEHEKTMEFSPSQYDIDGGTPIPGQSWQVIPCCQRNLKELAPRSLPDEWSLLVWQNCTCPGSVKENFEPPSEKFRRKYYGKQFDEMENILQQIFSSSS